MKLLICLTAMLAVLLQSGLSNAMSLDFTMITSSSNDKDIFTVARGPQSTNINDISPVQPVVVPISEADEISIVTASGIGSVPTRTQTSTCHTTSTDTAVPPANIKRNEGGYQPYGDPFDPPPPKSAAVANSCAYSLLLVATTLWVTLLLFSLPRSTIAATIPPAPSAPLASPNVKSNGGGYQPYGDPFDPPPRSGAPQGVRLCASLSVAVMVLWVVHFIFSIPHGAAAESTTTLGMPQQHKRVAGSAVAGGHGADGECALGQKAQSILLPLIETLLAALWVRYVFRQRQAVASGGDLARARN
ncbi:uncharacterized protein BKCO1_700073 [Diplodia corticola]|uniref:Uncharacterized protein n=1 Tax=Diplodia corticola TaxID=236234 RepID=A0A1J9RA86_9PEZI|nr:uncharacterized protein BKCO1_700073 [Diplodia corticola]OJD37456.1 hypothetical protein BKCO1_700073 [Diplodia corticola]